jgi:hypothetical protein
MRRSSHIKPQADLWAALIEAAKKDPAGLQKFLDFAEGFTVIETQCDQCEVYFDECWPIVTWACISQV